MFLPGAQFVQAGADRVACQARRLGDTTDTAVAKLLSLGSSPLPSCPHIQNGIKGCKLPSNPLNLAGIVHGRFVANQLQSAKSKLTTLLFRGP
jgi:hypothetical protein